MKIAKVELGEQTVRFFPVAVVVDSDGDPADVALARGVARLRELAWRDAAYGGPGLNGPRKSIFVRLFCRHDWHPDPEREPRRRHDGAGDIQPVFDLARRCSRCGARWTLRGYLLPMVAAGWPKDARGWPTDDDRPLPVAS